MPQCKDKPSPYQVNQRSNGLIDVDSLIAWTCLLDAVADELDSSH